MPATSHQSIWDERIARARDLAASRPSARELLTFYAALAEYQKSLAEGVSTGEPLQVERVLNAIPDFLSWLERTAPPDLATAVHDLSTLYRSDLNSLVASAFNLHDPVASAFRRKGAGAGDFLPPDRLRYRYGASAEALAKAEGGSHQTEGSDSPALQFVVESILQPFAEQLVKQASSRATVGSDPSMRCPRCAGLPVAAVLREAGHGSKRFLLCALCLTEWECLRIVCPACGEQSFDALPVYTAEQLPHVRIDACDRCHHYIKTIDLTKDGLAVPCVDDIASVALDLWAREQGYTRVKRNIVGL